MEITALYGSQGLPLPHHARSMSETELSECRGGMNLNFWVAVAGLIISNWQDIREGFSDGVSGKSPRY